MAEIDVVALANASLTLKLIDKLRDAGALTALEIDTLFADAIRQQREMRTPANDAAATYLEACRPAFERE